MCVMGHVKLYSSAKIFTVLSIIIFFLSNSLIFGILGFLGHIYAWNVKHPKEIFIDQALY